MSSRFEWTVAAIALAASVGAAVRERSSARPIARPAAHGAAHGAARPVLRVCADPNNLPFSNRAGIGRAHV